MTTSNPSIQKDWLKRPPYVEPQALMQNEHWKSFFLTSHKVLGHGAFNPQYSDSWCVWTTFSSLRRGVHYWSCGMPNQEDILDTHIADGGLWGQPFNYEDLAHIIVPANFYWETEDGPHFENGTKSQDISALSKQLSQEGIAHRVTDLVLEIKLY
jgi:hypothetical protein